MVWSSDASSSTSISAGKTTRRRAASSAGAGGAEVASVLTARRLPGSFRGGARWPALPAGRAAPAGGIITVRPAALRALPTTGRTTVATTPATEGRAAHGGAGAVTVEVWSDIACPFCYIGKRFLDEALEGDGGPVDVVWRSFLLAPDAPAREPGDIHSVLARRKGIAVAQARRMGERVTEMARGAGLRYDMDAVVPVNTHDAHRVLQMARDAGRAQAVAERLFAGYFTEGADLSDHAVLAGLGAHSGLDGDALAAMLASDALADRVRADADLARAFGLSAVPAFVLDRALLVSGAQPPEALREALRQARERRAAV
jgi:predicted DsbA family dithiol-disulfide isomerase